MKKLTKKMKKKILKDGIDVTISFGLAGAYQYDTVFLGKDKLTIGMDLDEVINLAYIEAFEVAKGYIDINVEIEDED